MHKTDKGIVDTSHSSHARFHTLPLGSAVLQDGFWSRRQQTVRSVSLQHAYQMLEAAGNFDNFRITASLKSGAYRGRNFMDENVYKWLEAVAHTLAKNPDPALQQMADEAIGLIATAQQPDGYLNTYYTLVEPDNRWADLDHGHELYCAGHFFQAAVAFHRAVGDNRLLDVATRFADYIASIFGPDKRQGACGHPEVEVALIELYRETDTRAYLDLAKFFIDQRGQGKMRGLGWYGPEYHQDRVPIREATIIEGHAVRALYLMAGVTDLYLETGEPALFDALSRLWDDMTHGKLLITGGAGARYEGESFGDPYELPNDQCYCETCASVANMMWNWRMLLATGDAKFADLMEQILYNGFLSGPALDGSHFFYINPLLSRGGYARAKWYEVSCCPPNIMRTIASIENYLVTTDAAGLQMQHYHAATMQATFGAGRCTALAVSTEYPWAGHVKITITETDDLAWELSLRIPSWSPESDIQLNGESVNVSIEAGYASIERIWQAGDVVELQLLIAPTLVVAHPFIDTTRSSVAIQRGPVLYCLEQVDHAQNIMAIQLDESVPLEAIWEGDLLGGVMTVKAAGYTLDTTQWEGRLYRPLNGHDRLAYQSTLMTAVPYYAWGNRGANPMRVWIPRASNAT